MGISTPTPTESDRAFQSNERRTSMWAARPVYAIPPSKPLPIPARAPTNGAIPGATAASTSAPPA